MSINRREFLKSVAIGTGLISLSGCVIQTSKGLPTIYEVVDDRLSEFFDFVITRKMTFSGRCSGNLRILERGGLTVSLQMKKGYDVENFRKKLLSPIRSKVRMDQFAFSLEAKPSGLNIDQDSVYWWIALYGRKL